MDYRPSPYRKGGQNVFALGHIKLDYNSKQDFNLQWNWPNTFSELVRTTPPTDPLTKQWAA